MGQILLPKQYHPDFALPGKKPIGPIEIDHSNPLGARVRYLALPGGNAGLKELVKSQSFVSGSTRNTEGTTRGLAQRIILSTDFLDVSNDIDYVPGELGLFTIADWTGSGGNDNKIITEKNFTSVSEPFYTFRIGHSRSAGNRQVIAQWNQGGTRRFFDNVGGFEPLPNIPFSTALSIRNGSQVLYAGSLNDILTEQETSTHSGTVTNYNTNLRVGGSINFPTNRQQGLVYLVMIVEGGFTESEVQSLHKNPYQILKPATAQLYNFPSVAAVTSVTTGTSVPTQTEDDLSGASGKTVVLTLTGDTFVTGTSSLDGIAAGSDSDQAASGTNWDSLVKSALDNTDVVLSGGNTVATITLPVFATYDISSTETITWTIPAASLTTSADPIVSSPTHTVTAVVAAGLLLINRSIANFGGMR